MKTRAEIGSAFMSFFERQGKTRVLITSLVATAIVGVLDFFTGYEVAFSVFYLVPVSLAAYFVGRGSGLLISLLSAIIWFMADIGAGHEYEVAWVPYWNGFTRFVFFAIVATFLVALRHAFEHERELARSDFLTGAANSRAFFEIADTELGRARRYGHPFSVAHIDVDNFKMVNDTLGHQAGDDLLRTIVTTMRTCLRDTDLVARLGGDEFAVLLLETGKDEALIAIRKLQGHLNEEVNRSRWPVTFSVGLLTCLDAPRSVDELLKLVDRLTYDAKNAGKNTIKQDVIAARLVSVVGGQP